jgi:hypothetical protein
MRRTLLAVGFAVLISLIFVPHVHHVDQISREPFFTSHSLGSLGPAGRDRVLWGGLLLQMTFACVLAAMIVNISWRRKPKIQAPVQENPRQEKPQQAVDWLSPAGGSSSQIGGVGVGVGGGLPTGVFISA